MEFLLLNPYNNTSDNHIFELVWHHIFSEISLVTCSKRHITECQEHACMHVWQGIGRMYHGEVQDRCCPWPSYPSSRTLDEHVLGGFNDGSNSQWNYFGLQWNLVFPLDCTWVLFFSEWNSFHLCTKKNLVGNLLAIIVDGHI
jgi:hypothetical protein